MEDSKKPSDTLLVLHFLNPKVSVKSTPLFHSHNPMDKQVVGIIAHEQNQPYTNTSSTPLIALLNKSTTPTPSSMQASSPAFQPNTNNAQTYNNQQPHQHHNAYYPNRFQQNWNNRRQQNDQNCHSANNQSWFKKTPQQQKNQQTTKNARTGYIIRKKKKEMKEERKELKEKQEELKEKQKKIDQLIIIRKQE